MKMLILKDLKLKGVTYKRHNQQLQCDHQWKNFYDQAIDSDTKRYEEIIKLTTWEGEDYTTGCLLDYKLIAVNLSRQK